MSNPTPILNMSKIYDHSRHGWTLSKVPSSSTDPVGSSRSFPAIPASSAVYRPRCLQVRFLSKTTIPVWNALPWSWRPSHWRRSSCVCSLSSHHDMCTYCTNCFSSFVPVWVHLCTASALHVPPSLFTVTTVWRDTFGGHRHLLLLNQNRHWQTHRQKSDRRTRDAPKLYQTSGWVQLKKDFEAVELFIQKHGKPVMVFYRASAYWRAILILQICPSVCLSVRLNTTIVTIEGE